MNTQFCPDSELWGIRTDKNKFSHKTAPYSSITKSIRYVNHGIHKSYLKSPGKSPGAQAINQTIETKRNDHTHYS